MARILLGWELGEGFGHVSTLLPVAKALAQCGHEPILVLHNVVETWALLRDSGFTVLQAPHFFVRSGDENIIHHSRSYADILAGYGYDDVDTLEPIVCAWRNLIESIKPDLVIAEHAPTLSLASYGRVPVISLGTGFEIADWDGDHFPVLNADVEECVPLATLTHNIETVLHRLGQTAPEPAIRVLFGEQTFVAVFSNIDPYRETRKQQACGPLWPLPSTIPPLPETPMCLVYLPADHPDLEKLISGLVNMKMQGMVYVRNASDHVIDLLSATSLEIYTEPVDLDAVMPRISVVLHHGGAGLTQRCLAYGRPQVIAPVYLEQQLTCTALQEMGVAIKLGGIFSVEQSGAALEQALAVPRLVQLAQSHAHILREHYSDRGSLDLLVQACLKKLPLSIGDTRPASITFVTTCKGRLHHLQKTLPLMVAEQPDEIIVVDYSCPQGAADWVESTFPRSQFPHVKVVRVTDDAEFCVSRARNIGASVSSSNWLCFIDADVCVQPGWINWMRNSLRDVNYYYQSPVCSRWSQEFAGTYGTVIVSRIAFDQVGGYDEVFRGWGGEDDDFYFLLKAHNFKAEKYPQSFLANISHSDDDRSKFYDEKNIQSSHLVAQYYRSVKSSLMRLEGKSLPLDARQELMSVSRSQLSCLFDDPEQKPKIIVEFIPEGGDLSIKGRNYMIRQHVVTMVEPLKIIKKHKSEVLKKFCVMTTGRSGSTSFMRCLEKHDDIALPNKNIRCSDNELLHEARMGRHMRDYEKICGINIVDYRDLIECFYTLNFDYGYAGFKSMPSRHSDFKEFIYRKDIQFITLIREDVASTVASFILARLTGLWQRRGEPQPVTWIFNEEEHGEEARGLLAEIVKNHALLASVPNAIAITYEELCNPAFENKHLNDFFGHLIRLDNPELPTRGSSYVENWEDFEMFIARVRKEIEHELESPSL